MFTAFRANNYVTILTCMASKHNKTATKPTNTSDSSGIAV